MKLGKLFASMGSVRAMENTEIDTAIEQKMKEIAGEHIAVSEKGGIWVGLQELNGYVFMETTVLSTIKIKTLKGVTLTFLGEEELKLTSDSFEISSEYAALSNRWMTPISFEITKKHLNYIRKKKFDQIRLDFKKRSLLFDAKQ